MSLMTIVAYVICVVNLFHVTGLFQNPLKTPKNQRFSGGIERDQWQEMSLFSVCTITVLTFFHNLNLVLIVIWVMIA